MDAKWYRRLGGKIARLRARAGLTQEQFAERADVAASYIARIENGSRHPTLDVLGRIANALSVPLYRLLIDDQAMRAAEAQEIWGRPARALASAVADLSDEDIALLVTIAARLRRE